MSEYNGVAKAANLTTIVVASLTTFALCGAGATWLITARDAAIDAFTDAVNAAEQAYYDCVNNNP